MKNNYDAVRLVLALIVVLSHIGALSAHPSLRWMVSAFDSDFAVKGFFAISGCLVSRSYCASASVRDYAEKRVRRIFPAYITVVVACTLLGAFVGRLSTGDYFASAQTWKYLAANVTLMGFLQADLPGVFDANPLHAVNGALWTIKVEVMLYFLVPAIVLAFRRWGAFATAVGSVLVGVAWRWLFEVRLPVPGAAEIARQFPGQLAYFGMGAVIGLDARSTRWLVPLLIVSTVLFVASWNAPWRGLIEPVFYACLVIWLATGTPPVEAGRHGDLSYGLYLVHFPIVQAIVATGLFARHPAGAVAACLVCAFSAAFASWHLVEKRTLRRSVPRPARAALTKGLEA